MQPTITETEEQIISTRQKALKINLDKPIYGSFAEIGAGQEAAAVFFKAGGASGTVAKTMSAYDMTFSDAIYGKEESGRYVCEPRLMKMLAKEYGLLEVRLGKKRGNETTFFAFANTVTTVNFSKTSQGHGWLGVRFQLTPQSEPNDAILHVRMGDKDALSQQHAYGVLGVNLIYACFYYWNDPEKFINSLMDSLSRERVEIDMLRLEGPNFKNIDNRLLSLKLVRLGVTDATMFAPDQHMLQPADALYKKNVLVIRGRYRPVTLVNMDILQKGKEQFLKDLPDAEHPHTVVLAELNLQDLFSTNNDIDEKDFIDRVELLCSLGHTVMISSYTEHHRLIAYLSQLTRKKIAIVVGRNILERLCDENHYKDLKGGILEGFSRLFINDLHMYVYPYLMAHTHQIQHCLNLELSQHLKPLYQYLLDNRKITDIENYNPEVLQIYSDKVIMMIKNGEPGWERMVHPDIAKKIKDNCLFGYPCETTNKKKEFYLRTY